MEEEEVLGMMRGVRPLFVTIRCVLNTRPPLVIHAHNCMHITPL